MPDTRPYVICHMMTSLDGRLAVGDWTEFDGNTRKDRVAAYEAIHDALDGDAWIVGRVTMGEMAKGDPHPPADPGSVERPIHDAGGAPGGYAIAIDQHAKLHFTGGPMDGERVIVLLGRDVPDAHLAELAADGVSYIVAETDAIDLAAMLATLRTRFAIKRLLLEGGAGMNGSFLKARLVDELSLLVAPAFGGRTGGRAIVEGGEGGIDGSFPMELLACERLAGGMVHLRYALPVSPAR